MRIDGILAALTTPFAPDGSVALDRFRENLARYDRTQLRGYVVVGSTGESVLLGIEEIDRIWGTARECTAPGKLLIAGTGVDSTGETIARTRRAAELGYDAVLVKTPHYFKPLLTPAALERHYLAIADASPLPVLIYSIPQYTGISVAADWLARLAEHPNIGGIKESSGNVQLAAEIVRCCPPEFSTLVGSSGTLFPSLLLGVAGGVLALACFLPEPAIEIYEAVRAGDTERASRIQIALLAPSRKVAGELGPTGVKYAMDCMGYYGGDPRPPLLPLTEAQKKTVEAVLAESIARHKADHMGVVG
jgi:dihydrodipicolinate synthase/N-acetylneuraminate lyase